MYPYNIPFNCFRNFKNIIFYLFIVSDIEFFKKQKCSLANPTLLPQNNSDFDIITEGKLHLTYTK